MNAKVFSFTVQAMNLVTNLFPHDSDSTTYVIVDV